VGLDLNPITGNLDLVSKDVRGPLSPSDRADNTIARWDGVTGKLLKDSAGVSPATNGFFCSDSYSLTVNSLPTVTSGTGENVNHLFTTGLTPSGAITNAEYKNVSYLLQFNLSSDWTSTAGQSSVNLQTVTQHLASGNITGGVIGNINFLQSLSSGNLDFFYGNFSGLILFGSSVVSDYTGFIARMIDAGSGSVTEFYGFRVPVGGASATSVNRGISIEEPLCSNYMAGNCQVGQDLQIDGQYYTPKTALTFGATTNWDLDGNQSAELTLTGNTILASPSNGVSGANYTLKIAQDGTGGHTVTWNAIYKFAGGTAPTVSVGAGAVDVFRFLYDGTNYLCVSQQQDIR